MGHNLAVRDFAFVARVAIVFVELRWCQRYPVVRVEKDGTGERGDLLRAGYLHTKGFAARAEFDDLVAVFAVLLRPS